MLFYPDGWELAVDNPGRGELLVRALTKPVRQRAAGQGGVEPRVLRPKVGQLLAAITAKALGDTPGKAHAGPPTRGRSAGIRADLRSDRSGRGPPRPALGNLRGGAARQLNMIHR
jgi:hypothetical protein